MDSPFSSGESKSDLSGRFISDMLKMFHEGSFNDVLIKLHDGEIRANKSVLAARCEYFAASFRWKDNNKQEVEEIVIDDCSKKIMTRIIEYIFTGILKVKDLNLLDFLEFKDQVRKMFPGDNLDREIEDTTELKSYQMLKINDNIYYSHTTTPILPTNEEIAKALSLVKTGKLPSEVMVELARAIETSIWHEKPDLPKELKARTKALADLVSYGVIDSVQHLKLNLFRREPPGSYLFELIPCVKGTLDICNLEKGLSSGHNLKTLLDVAYCEKLQLSTERLNKEETEALASAMRSRVEILSLMTFKDWEMDYDTFSKYKGDGKCREVHLIDNSDQCWSELFELFDYSNSKDRIVVFGIRIRSIFKFRIVFELFE